MPWVKSPSIVMSMASVSLLAQYLLKLDPQKNVGRISFYHFLKNFCDMGEDLTPQIVTRFYRRALGFQYWQTHKEALGKIVEQDLKSFIQDMHMPTSLGQIRHAHQTQVLQIEQDHDFENILSSYFGETLKNGERLKILPMGDKRWLTLKLSVSGLLEVQVYGMFVLIEAQKLMPLEPIFNLQYSSQLDLIPQTTHWIETAPLTSTRFQMLENGVQGHTIRGYTFQKYETLQGGNLSQHAELFFALKKIERLFVQPETDPFYQELVSILEKSYNMLTISHPESRRMAESALAKGQQALKTVFPNDKLLLLLVTNIEFLLGQKGQFSGDIWRKPKPLSQ